MSLFLILRSGGAAQQYTLVATTGAYVKTGISAATLMQRRITATDGAATWTGTVVPLLVSPPPHGHA